MMPTSVLADRVQGPLAAEIGLRPAVAADEPFLYQVYASAREQELGLVGWDDDQKGALLQMQFAPEFFVPTKLFRLRIPGGPQDRPARWPAARPSRSL